MISDEPDEDADSLDDDNLLETYLGSSVPQGDAGSGGAPGMLDWPPSHARTAGVSISAKTLAWFQANHASWRLEIEHVLSAWIVARTQVRPDDRQPSRPPPDVPHWQDPQLGCDRGDKPQD